MVNNPSPINSYAIDFGTSNTVIARWNSVTEQGELVKLPELAQQLSEIPPLIPSLVYVQDAAAHHTLLGQPVRDQGLDLVGDARFFRNFKRGIGTSIQGFLPELDGRKLSFEQVGTWFLEGLINKLEALSPGKIDNLILTVPVDSFESYRKWLMELCQSLDVEQVRILDEPTAAALGYGAAESGLILVVDFGGGTIDFSLVRLKTEDDSARGAWLKQGNSLLEQGSLLNTAKVIAKAGDNLGGADIDNWIVDYFAKSQNLPRSSFTTRLAERLKIKLSSSVSAQEAYFDDETFSTYDLSLERDHLEQILAQHGFFERLDELMKQILQRALRRGIEPEEIDTVLMVGGSVQIPAVQSWIKQHFSEQQLKSQQQFEAIAIGALQICQQSAVEDFLYHSYGVRYWNRRTKQHDWHPIIKAGQPYPLPKPVELVLGASTPKQSNIELVIGELGSSKAVTEVYLDGDQLVTRTLQDNSTVVQALNDSDSARTIAQLDPPGNPGSDRLKLLFNVDQARQLRITVEDLLTRKSLLNNYIVTRLN